MQFTAYEVGIMRQSLLYRPEKDKKTGETKLAKRLLDPSEELDALSIHKKTGSCIEGSGEDMTLKSGEFELSDDEKKMVARFANTFPVSAEAIESKQSLLEKVK